MSWEHLFPFSRIRETQTAAINFALDAFNSGKRFVVLEAGTGIGKSAIGITIARALETDAYLLTTQKVLQDQYVSDFGPEKLRLLQSIKSASNYECHGVWGQTCAESRRIIAALKKKGLPPHYQSCRDSCPYMEDKRAFIASPLGVTNFSYFLAETMYAKQLKPRGLLVCDEAHNVEAQLSSFIEVSFSVKFAKQQLDCKGPRTRTADGVLAWIRRSYRPALVKRLAELEEQVEQGADDESSTLAKRLEMLDKHLCKVNRFLATWSAENWIMNAVDPGAKPITSRRNNSASDWKFEFKPIDVSPYAEDALYHYGDKVLLMSATIIDPDVFCRIIGIDKKQVAFLSLPSPFPAENRPVHYVPVGSMSRKHIDETLPTLVEAVKMLLERHSGEKGIIHAGTYKIARHIHENVNSDRLIIHDSETREMRLEEHLRSTRPTVLISPSMTEGVDLKDDASRWQIIAKVPFPYLGDEMTQKRMARDGRWYDFVTARTVIQALGRSVRNENDHAMSYILDSDWRLFYRRAQSMFNDDFRTTYHQD